jgi:cytochrome c oxidase subunit 2
MYPVTEWGKEINHVYLITTIICAVIFVVVAGVLVYALAKFKEKEGDTHIPKQVRGNHTLEILWTLIPVVLLIFIFVPTVENVFKHSEVPENALEIEVIGHQWWWEFKYPSLGVTTANELHLPENTPILFKLTSADVIHSFWIPRMGGKIDTLPGQINTMTFTTPVAEKDGGDYYQGQCVELCGLSHALMRFQAVVHKQAEFDRWVESHNKAPIVVSDKEKQGQELMATKICITCHTIEGTSAVGQIGPNLTNFGSRQTVAAGIMPNTPESLRKWLKDPPAVKPGSLMPNLSLTDEEIDALSAYLLQSTAKKY